GIAAMAKRIAVISAGGSSSSASRLATKARPQMTATKTAMQTSAGFMVVFLALPAGCRFLQEIRAVERRVIVRGQQPKTDLGRHALHHPSERGIFVAHVGHDAIGFELVILDVEVRPLADVALTSVRHADKHNVAQVETRARLQ